MNTKVACKHKARTRYTHGFFCDDCNTFFGSDTSTYRSSELLNLLHMVCHNLNVKHNSAELLAMGDKIGLGVEHGNFEELIAETEKLLERYNASSADATIVLE